MPLRSGYTNSNERVTFRWRAIATVDFNKSPISRRVASGQVYICISFCGYFPCATDLYSSCGLFLLLFQNRRNRCGQDFERSISFCSLLLLLLLTTSISECCSTWFQKKEYQKKSLWRSKWSRARPQLSSYESSSLLIYFTPLHRSTKLETSIWYPESQRLPNRLFQTLSCLHTYILQYTCTKNLDQDVYWFQYTAELLKTMAFIPIFLLSKQVASKPQD